MTVLAMSAGPALDGGRGAGDGSQPGGIPPGLWAALLDDAGARAVSLLAGCAVIERARAGALAPEGRRRFAPGQRRGGSPHIPVSGIAGLAAAAGRWQLSADPPPVRRALV